MEGSAFWKTHCLARLLLLLSRLVMLGEQVRAEIAFEAAPDAVDVVGFVLHVVVFQQEGLALHAVVVGLAALFFTGPGEVDGAVFLDFLPGGFGDLGAQALEVFFDQALQGGLLLRVEIGLGDAFRVEGIHMVFGGGDHFLGGLDQHVGLGPLLFVEGLDQGAAQLFLIMQHAQALHGAFADFAGVGTEEGRRGAGEFAVLDGEVHGDVVALDAPAPGAGGAGGAEDAHKVFLRVALLAGLGALGFVLGAFDLIEHFLQAHDGLRLHHAAEAEAAGHEGVGEQALLRGHLQHGQTFTRARNEVPVLTLLVFELEGGLGAQLGGEIGEEGGGELGHLPGGIMGAGGRGMEKRKGGGEAKHKRAEGRDDLLHVRRIERGADGGFVRKGMTKPE